MSANIIILCEPPQNEEQWQEKKVLTGTARTIMEDALEAGGLKKGDYAFRFLASPVGEYKLLKTPTQIKGPYLEVTVPRIVKEKPLIIVTVGANPLKSVSENTKKLSDYQYKAFANTFVHNGEEHSCMVFPIPAPGYIFYNDHLMPEYQEKIAGIKALLKDYDKTLESAVAGGMGNYKIVTDFDACIERLSFFSRMGKAGKVIAFDTETSHINPHTKKARVGVISLSHKPRTGTALCFGLEESEWGKQDLKLWKKIVHDFFSQDFKWVAQNGKFDCKWMLKHYGVRIKLYADTMLMHFLRDEERGTHGLKQQAVKYTDMGGYEDELAQHIPDKSEPYAFLKPPSHVVGKYAAADACCTLRLYREHRDWIKQSGNKKWHMLAYSAYPKISDALMMMEYHGAKVDLAFARKYKEWLENKSNEVLTRIRSHKAVKKFIAFKSLEADSAYDDYVTERRQKYELKLIEYRTYLKKCKKEGKKPTRKEPQWVESKLKDKGEAPEFNVNSVDQLRAVMFEYIKHEIYETTDSGEPSTGKASLIHYKNFAKCKLSADILEYRLWSKTLSTYIAPMEELAAGYDTGAYIYGNFNQIGTASGRLSANHPNLQNISSKGGGGVKRCYVSRFSADGGYLIFFDFSQIELRLAASLSRDKVMCRIYRERGDIHTETTKGIYNLTQEEFDNTDPKEKKEKRKIGKTYNFATVYGSSPRGIVQLLAKDDPPTIISDDEAQDNYDNFKALYKGLFKYIEGRKKFIRDHGYAECRFGMWRRLPMVNSEDEANQARAMRQGVNSDIQGTAGMMMLCCLVVITEEFEKRKLKSIPFVTVHDSVGFDIHPGEGEIVAEIANRVMSNPKESLVSVVGADFDWSWLCVPIEASWDVGYNWRDMIQVGEETEYPAQKKAWEKKCKDLEAKGKKPNPANAPRKIKMDTIERCLEWSRQQMAIADAEFHIDDDVEGEKTEAVNDFVAEENGEGDAA
jgi:DNA polymerase I-like protein with 3'-5' exonuclease and polymerase domains/uracil-DNA glycosylase